MKSKITNLLERSWDGSNLTSIIKIDGQKYKLKAGLRNGTTNNDALILGTAGWEYFVTAFESGFKRNPNGTSYVSNEDERQDWAEDVLDHLEKVLLKTHGA